MDREVLLQQRLIITTEHYAYAMTIQFVLTSIAYRHETPRHGRVASAVQQHDVRARGPRAVRPEGLDEKTDHYDARQSLLHDSTHTQRSWMRAQRTYVSIGQRDVLLGIKVVRPERVKVVGSVGHLLIVRVSFTADCASVGILESEVQLGPAQLPMHVIG